MEAGARVVGVHLGDVARAARALEGERVAVRRRGRAPDPVDRAGALEHRADHVRRTRVGIGRHRGSAGANEPGGVVVDPLLRLRERSLGQPRLGVAAGVAQVVEQHDGVLGELDLAADVFLAEVLVLAVAPAGDRVQPEAVLGGREEVIAVAARPAVAVAHVDHDRCVLQGGLDPRPGRVGRRDHGDVGRVAPRDPGGFVGLRAEAVGHAGPDRADDDDDFRRARCSGDDGNHNSRHQQRREKAG